MREGKDELGLEQVELRRLARWPSFLGSWPLDKAGDARSR